MNGPVLKIAIAITAAFALLLCSALSRAQVPRFDHVFIVVEENQDFSCVIGNSTMPFLNGLAAKYGVATSYYANGHPSISNYFVLTTGQAISKGRMGDFRTDAVDVDNVIRELKQNGKTWRAYVEGVPGPGYMGGNIDSTGYVKRHNPLAYFQKDMSPAERANLAPFSQFSDDLTQNHLANYTFFVPNLYDDGHSIKGSNGRDQGSARCGDANALKQADDWLKNIFSPLLASKVFEDTGLLVITYDEASNDDESDGAGHWGGGRVATIVVSSKMKPAYRSIVLFHHESTLRLMLEALGLDENHWPGGAKNATSMAEFFLGSK
ncbi:MAG: phosphoesterase [Candidatus Acidoferrum typicum]|nr:phosphoesterase [Candidatus Acidoferrum typicum]